MIIFDLDGTLADCEHRRHFVDASKHPDYIQNVHYTDGDLHRTYVHKDTGVSFKPNWKAFNEACDRDKPIIPTSKVYSSLKKVFFAESFVIWSGRCESVRRQTEWWLNTFIDSSIYWDDNRLKMRPEGDSTPDDELKERWLREYIAGGGKPVSMVFDDRPKVVRMWQKRGIFVFNCAQSDKEF